jgi:hypothetical protein
MDRLIFVLGLVMLTRCGDASKSQSVDLDKLEKINEAEKIKLIQTLKPQFEYLATYDTWVSDNLKNFYFVDLDDDQDRDVIFTGWSGAEPVCVRIFVTKNNIPKKVFDAFQRIKRIEFTENRLSHLTIEDPGCCAEYILFTADYKVSTAQDDLKFDMTKRMAIIHETELPKDFFSTPIRFEVQNDKYFMRNSAQIDTVDQYYGGELGIDNIVAEFKKGTKGKALGEKIDATGRVWWFVEIDSNFKPSNTMFYDIDNTQIRGWMSSRHLKRL